MNEFNIKSDYQKLIWPFLYKFAIVVLLVLYNL